jgi:hypothetical protein
MNSEIIEKYRLEILLKDEQNDKLKNKIQEQSIIYDLKIKNKDLVIV